MPFTATTLRPAQVTRSPPAGETALDRGCHALTLRWSRQLERDSSRSHSPERGTRSMSEPSPAAQPLDVHTSAAGRPSVLFVYFTYTNQTAKVLDVMAEELRARGCAVTMALLEFTDPRYDERFRTFPELRSQSAVRLHRNRAEGRLRCRPTPVHRGRTGVARTRAAGCHRARNERLMSDTAYDVLIAAYLIPDLARDDFEPW